MAQPTESQIRAAWEVYGQPQGIPYADYRAQVLASGGALIPTSAGAVGGGGGGAGAGDSTSGVSPDNNVLAYLAHATSGDIPRNVATGGDGSLDYYKQQSAAIDEALNSPNVSDERKRELRQMKAELDDAYFTPREADAKTNLENAGSDADALKALHAIEGLRSTGGTSTGVSGRFIGGQAVDPSLAGSGAINDPTDVAEMRREYDAGGFAQQGISFEQYQQMVKEANPDGYLRYTGVAAKNADGTPKTFSAVPDLSKSPGAQTAASTAARNAQIRQDASLGYFDNVTSRANANYENAVNTANGKDAATLAKLQAAAAATKTKTSGYADDLSAAARTANDESRASQLRYTGAVDSYETANNAALSDYISGIAPYQHEIAGTTRQDVAFDPEGLAMQEAAYNQGGDIYNGSLDYQSQAAKAYANPADVQRALEGIDMLRQNATTGGDDQRENLRIARDEYAHGGEQQQEVYDRFKEISHPEMTADERNILAQSQREYATQDKANRDAVAQDLAARGMMSGAAQIAGQQAAQQRLGEERVAGTLGAQGEAVQRAFAALQGMQTSAEQIRTGNQNAEQLMQSAANALRSGDLAAANAFTAAAQRQREEGFAEEYARGTAADNASANNQRTRLGGAQIQATEANAIRSANDQINMFNNEQQGITDRFNAGFQQSEYERLTGLQQSTLNNKVGINDKNLGAETGLEDRTQSDISTRFGRTNTADQTGIGVAMGNWGIDQSVAGAESKTTGTELDRAGQVADRSTNTAKDRINLGRTTDKDVQDALDRLAGSRYGI